MQIYKSVQIPETLTSVLPAFFGGIEDRVGELPPPPGERRPNTRLEERGLDGQKGRVKQETRREFGGPGRGRGHVDCGGDSLAECPTLHGIGDRAAGDLHPLLERIGRCFDRSECLAGDSDSIDAGIRLSTDFSIRTDRRNP